MEVIPVFADPLSFGACFVVGMFEQNDLIPPCVAGCVVLASMLGLYYLVGHEVDVVFRSFCVRKSPELGDTSSGDVESCGYLSTHN